MSIASINQVSRIHRLLSIYLLFCDSGHLKHHYFALEWKWDPLWLHSFAAVITDDDVLPDTDFSFSSVSIC